MSSASRSTSAVMRVSSCSSRRAAVAGCSDGSTIPAGLHRGVAALRQQQVHLARLEVTSDHHRGDPGSSNLPCP